MPEEPNPTTLTSALAAKPAWRDLRPEDLALLPQKGLAHAHWRLRDRGLVVRVPRFGHGVSAAEALARQAAAFGRSAPSGHTPRLHAVLDPAPGLPFGALVVDDVGGRPPSLPAELSLIAESLASIHSIPLPMPEDRPPLADEHDAFAATLAIVERHAAFLDRAGIDREARRQIEEELAWARDFASTHHRAFEPAAQTLVVADAHPGNFIVTPTGLAMFVDLEKAAYGSPAIDIAHATLLPATRWDSECGVTLARDEILRFVRAYFTAVGPALEGAIRPWLIPMRRLTWLRTTTIFARFHVEQTAKSLAPAAAAHVTAVIADCLTPATIATTRTEWLGPDALTF